MSQSNQDLVGKEYWQDGICHRVLGVDPDYKELVDVEIVSSGVKGSAVAAMVREAIADDRQRTR